MGGSSWVKVLATKYDDLNLTPSGRKELTPYSCPLMYMRVCVRERVRTRMCTDKHPKKERKKIIKGHPKTGNADLKR